MSRERAVKTVCARVSTQAANFLHELGGKLYLKHLDGHNAFSLHGSSVRVAVDYLIYCSMNEAMMREYNYNVNENLYYRIVRKEKEMVENVMEKQS